MDQTTPNLSLVTVADTTAPECDFVRQWLREHNWKANPDFMGQLQQPEHHAQSLVLIAKMNSLVVGGLFAETQLAWLRISIIAVDPDWRSRGIGAAILNQAEQQAVSRGCKYAYLDTMDYQAPNFYLAHGFNIVGQIPDWDSHGHSKLYFSKKLQQSS